MKKILRASLIIILSAIIVQIIFGSEASFLPGDFIATVTGIFSSIGVAGLVGFLLGALCLYIVLKKQIIEKTTSSSISDQFCSHYVS